MAPDETGLSIERQLGVITTKLEYMSERLDEQSRQMAEMQASIDSIQVERATEKGTRKTLVAVGALVGAIVGAGSTLVVALTSSGLMK